MRDVRCLLLKIADRDNNLRTIEALKEHKQVRIGFETQAIYQPLKNALCYDKAKTIEDARACF
jgi:GTP pyrophosphokinase